MEVNTIQLDKKALMSGKSFHFDNEQDCIKNQHDHLVSCEVCYSEQAYSGGMQLWFNGTIIHGCKTMKSLQRRFDQLVEKWNLQPCADPNN